MILTLMCALHVPFERYILYYKSAKSAVGRIIVAEQDVYYNNLYKLQVSKRVSLT